MHLPIALFFLGNIVSLAAQRRRVRRPSSNGAGLLADALPIPNEYAPLQNPGPVEGARPVYQAVVYSIVAGTSRLDDTSDASKASATSIKPPSFLAALEK